MDGRAGRARPSAAGAGARLSGCEVLAGRDVPSLRRRPLAHGAPAVGPWVAAKIHGWLDDPPPVPEPEETGRGFLTYAEVRRTLDVDPQWEATPCADLQVHTTFSDGGLPLSEMVEAATGVNLWSEWARLEASPDVPY